MAFVGPPEFLNAAGKTYPAVRDRMILSHMGAQAGVYTDIDFLTTWTSGMNLSVQFGDALIKATHPTLVNKGLYHINSDAAVPVTIPAANASNPRIDQIVLTVQDPSFDPAVTNSTPLIQVLQGTPTPGATLNNRSGAVATLPPSSLRLADVLVPTAAAALSAASIRDRRTFARGIQKRAIASTADNISISTTPTLVPAAAIRAEITGDNPVEITMLYGAYTSNAATTSTNTFIKVGVSYSLDGVVAHYVDPLDDPTREGGQPMRTQRTHHVFKYVTVPPANMIGSCLFQPWFALYENPLVGNQVVLSYPSLAIPLQLTVRELLQGTTNTFPTT